MNYDVNRKHYLSEEEYNQISETVYNVSGLVLFSFAKQEFSIKEQILRNFVARSATSLRSVFVLYDLTDYQNCWVVNRTAIDRLFHLHALGENNDYELFDDWSFFKKYGSQNAVKSDLDFKNQTSGWEYRISKEQKERMNRLSLNIPKWRKPDPKTIAKEMGMPFLYKYGYDYASKFVHPHSDDGLEDFYNITKLESSLRFPSHITVLSNSVLVATIILQEVMNQSSLKWRSILWDFIDQARNSIETGDNNYLETYLKVIELCKSMTLGEK